LPKFAVFVALLRRGIYPKTRVISADSQDDF
jgi:hypothetical protein